MFGIRGLVNKSVLRIKFGSLVRKLERCVVIYVPNRSIHSNGAINEMRVPLCSQYAKIMRVKCKKRTWTICNDTVNDIISNITINDL